jgi:RNA polymerase sigma-70 factor (ECF subfamily)
MVSEADEVTTASTQIDELPIPMPSTTPGAGFAELYERHYEAVFRAALRVTGNPADAEDVLQTVFLRVLARGGDVKNVALPAAYFRRAAVNAAVDVLRRRELHAESIYDDSTPHAAVQPSLLLKERLRRAIAALDSEDASLFLLRYVEGLSIEDLAGMFELEKNNVTVRLHRIRQRLQARDARGDAITKRRGLVKKEVGDVRRPSRTSATGDERGRHGRRHARGRAGARPGEGDERRRRDLCRVPAGLPRVSRQRAGRQPPHPGGRPPQPLPELSRTDCRDEGREADRRHATRLAPP